jgi:hypothetical protein
VLKAAWHCGGGSSVAYDSFGSLGSTPSYICLPHPCTSAGGDCVIPWFLWTNMDKKSTEKEMVKALASNLVTHANIIMEPSDYDENPLCKILHLVRCMRLLAE